MPAEADSDPTGSQRPDSSPPSSRLGAALGPPAARP